MFSVVVRERQIRLQSLSVSRRVKRPAQRSVKLARIASARRVGPLHPHLCRRELFLSVVLPRQHQHLRPPGQRPAQQLQCLLRLPSEEFVLPLVHLQRLPPQQHRHLSNRRFLRLNALRHPLRTLRFSRPSRRTSQLTRRPRRRNTLRNPLKQRLAPRHSLRLKSPRRQRRVMRPQSPSSRLQL